LPRIFGHISHLWERGAKRQGGKMNFFPSCQGREGKAALSDLIDVALGDLNSLM
jgi:hypothetical protein